MGWDFTPGDKKKDVINRCTKDWTNVQGQKRTCIRYTVKGNILWAIWEDETDIGNKRIIVCTLLRDEFGYWGHKSMCEVSHPYYYTCPLEYLLMVPVTCKKWREKVIEFHHA